MAMSVNPAIEGNPPLSSGHGDPAAMIRPRSTVPIRARGHVVPHQQAAHMTATGRTCTRVKTLASRGHPHMTTRNAQLQRVEAQRVVPEDLLLAAVAQPHRDETVHRDGLSP